MEPNQRNKDPLQKKKIEALKQKWLRSRNFWTFFVSGSFSSLVFLYFIYKCKNLDGTFDHVAAKDYFNAWSTTILMFWGLFVLNNTSKTFLLQNKKEKDTESEVAA